MPLSSSSFTTCARAVKRRVLFVCFVCFLFVFVVAISHKHKHRECDDHKSTTTDGHATHAYKKQTPTQCTLASIDSCAPLSFPRVSPLAVTLSS